MILTINGSQKEFPKEMSVAEFVEVENYTLAYIAIEVNGTIVPKAAYQETLLHSGDVLEVVSFVGGG